MCDDVGERLGLVDFDEVMERTGEATGRAQFGLLHVCGAKKAGDGKGVEN